NDYVTKPFQSEEVLSRVHTHLTRRLLEEKLEQANRDLESRVIARTAELTAALGEVERLKSRLQQENQYLQREIAETANLSEIIGSSAALHSALHQVAVVAPTDSTVLIHGETGTGKELIARALHEGGPRRDRPMIKLNCSAISAGLVESELFGHVKGAFTGATDRRVGRFELADGGTIFLDEVSELPLDTQAKLLRVLQEREFEPVGSSKTLKVDVRVVAATNRDLAADARSGRFRADLFYRLNVFPIQLPPLRERREDIGMLAEHFMRRMARKLGKSLLGIDPDTLRALESYSWPGNIRDLQNTIERAAVLTSGTLLRIDWDLDPDHGATAGVNGSSESAAQAQPLQRMHAAQSHSMQAVERSHIIATLKKTHGVVEGPHGAARLLNMNASTTRFRMKKLGITRADYQADGAN
ncbi:MAG TPA: sigma 54-interacting transcriptional regulator, partial [Steroidobacteraceae bacterium]